MRIPSFKIVVLLICGVIQLNAQQSKTHKEEFKVDKDVTIDIDTRHADIIIETWNKNKVVVEACMTIEGKDVSEERKEELFKNWDFEALGNKSQIDIKSRTNAFIDINTFDFDAPNYAIYTDDLVDFSLGTLDVLDSVDFIMPPMPSEPFVIMSDIEFAPMPDVEFAPMPLMITEFDFEAYKKDKDYLNKWKKENKTLFGKNIDVTIGDNSIAIVGDDTNIMMLKEKKKYEKEIAEAKKIYNKERKNAMKAYKKAKEELKKKRKKVMKERKEALKNRKVEAIKSRKVIQELLKNKLKQKVKRTIKIKVPKDAKFHMNVKYGTLSFSK